MKKSGQIFNGDVGFFSKCSKRKTRFFKRYKFPTIFRQKSKNRDFEKKRKKINMGRKEMSLPPKMNKKITLKSPKSPKSQKPSDTYTIKNGVFPKNQLFQKSTFLHFPFSHPK